MKTFLQAAFDVATCETQLVEQGYNPMKRMFFYLQRRNDGGVRSGIKIEDTHVWMHFVPGSDLDLSLLWYVMVELEGESLPEEPEAARQLFCDFADPILAALTEIIEELRSETGLLVQPTYATPVAIKEGVTLRVVCSAIRLLEARDVLPSLVDLKQHWQAYLDKLDLLTTAAK